MRRVLAALLLPAAILSVSACASAPARVAPAQVAPAPVAPARVAPAPFVMGEAGAIARARADSLRYPYTQADIDFMTGMIHHHAQAVLISRWAPTHGASPAVQRLTARIINAQTDEIALMQTWLADRNQPFPTVDTAGTVTMPVAASTTAAAGAHDAHAGHGEHAGHGAAAHDHTTMPGMLSDAQLAELDAARGEEFDRLFLTFMIAHHRGAVTMVRELFTHPGAGQDETIFKFAADVEVDQSTEIKRMLSMILAMGVPPPTE
jgi:uncharacterized protein (DUF305 family)